jgi:large subunit ribosomal protein L37Ae
MVNFSVRGGASLRKRNAEIKQQKIALYKCNSCGRMTVERVSTSIWRCRHCKATYAGGAYVLSTTAGEVAKRQIEGLKKQS